MRPTKKIRKALSYVTKVDLILCYSGFIGKKKIYLLSKQEQIELQNEVVLYYNPKYEINTYESILI